MPTEGKCCEQCRKENVILGFDVLPPGKVWCADCSCHRPAGEGKCIPDEPPNGGLPQEKKYRKGYYYSPSEGLDEVAPGQEGWEERFDDNFIDPDFLNRPQAEEIKSFLRTEIAKAREEGEKYGAHKAKAEASIECVRHREKEIRITIKAGKKQGRLAERNRILEIVRGMEKKQVVTLQLNYNAGYRNGYIVALSDFEAAINQEKQ